MKIFRLVILAFTLFFTIAILIPTEDDKSEQIFNAKLEEKILNGEEKIFLKDLTDFEWSNGCYVRMYQDSNHNSHDLEGVLGENYNNLRADSKCGEIFSGPMWGSPLIFKTNDGNRLINIPYCYPDFKAPKNIVKEYECFDKNALLEMIYNFRRGVIQTQIIKNKE